MTEQIAFQKYHAQHKYCGSTLRLEVTPSVYNVRLTMKPFPAALIQNTLIYSMP